MKTRLVSSLVLAAAIALGASGCSLFAHQATTQPYAPSDGIDLTVAGVDVRNLMLIAAEDGETFNVVFTAVNRAESAQNLRISFVDASGAASGQADFIVQPGAQQFGDPDSYAAEGDANGGPQLVAIPDVTAGQTVTAYVQIAGGQDVKREVPVLDGTLEEYQRFVVPGPTLLPTEGETAVS